MKRGHRFVLPFALLALFGLSAVAGSARAGDEHGVAPATFDDALAAARLAGKPLVVELFAVW